ncbi:MAG: DNA replication and repair protein RecF [Bacilli bacterium]|nr:DNA replication and repair protein RecF [Bacilli bacterium]MDD4406602.1 DNA replication and repair protein RecF [Bacilli bacterium]
MQILQLKLVNFRNYKQNLFNFSSKKNIILGNNGLGKTNIVEAIYYLALTKSFRVNNDIFLINNESKYSIIEGKIKDTITNSYKIIIENKNKRVFINNNQIKKLSDYISKINIINFNPEDLKLIKDSPSIHRQLINIEISQFDNIYLKNLSIYNKILKQRNSHLKNLCFKKNYNTEYLYILTEKLINYGINIYNLRKLYIENINKYLNTNFKKITKKDGLILKYISNYENLTKDELIKKYINLYQSDINCGKTNFGIHLDDFIFYYQNVIAKNYLSEGEQKNVIIAFKLAEINIFIDIKKIIPILILDDLFSEIDSGKINKIFKLLKKSLQIFITTTDISNIDDKTLQNSKIFKLKNNSIEEIIYE